MTPPGWYADPNDPSAERYWDGDAWTGEVRPSPDAPPAAPRRRTGRIVVFVFLALAVAAGAVVGALFLVDRAEEGDFSRTGATVTAGRGDGDADIDDVLGALRAGGVECDDPPSPPLGPEALGRFLAAVPDVAASVDGVSEVRDELDRAVRSIDQTQADLRACGRSILLSTGDRVRFAVFVAVDPAVVQRVADLGLHLASLAPPTIDATVAAVRDAGDTCMATARRVTRAVVVAEVAARASAGGPAPTPAETTAISHLPDTRLTVRNCNGTTVYGVGRWALAVVMGPGSPVSPDQLTAVGPVEVAGP